MGGFELRDLGPLKGMKLEVLGLLKCGDVEDLAPLRSLPLRSLTLDQTSVSDLEPLRGMRLESLTIGETKVRDLSPLQGMPVKTLYIQSTQVTDLTPLEGMELSLISFTPSRITKGIEVLRRMKTIGMIGPQPHTLEKNPASFWKRYDAGEFK